MKLPEPFYKDDYVTIYLGDCKDILWELPCHFAQSIFTDPPYKFEGDAYSYLAFDGGRDYITDIQDAELSQGFDFDLLEIMEAKLAYTNMLFFCNKNQIYEYLKYTRENKYRFQLLEWHKPNPIPLMGAGNIYLPDTEFIMHIFEKLQLEKRSASNTFFIHNVVRNEFSECHPTVKPEIVISKIIRHTTDKSDIIIDPFLGTGTTAVCAKKLGRKCIGIEIKEKYAIIAKERCTKTEANQLQAVFWEL